MFQTDNTPSGWRFWLRCLSSGTWQPLSCAANYNSTSSESESSLTSLDQIRPGHTFQISRVKEGKGLCCKLYGMGLVPGTSLTVQQNAGQGPVVISIQGSKIGLGRGMARHIWGHTCLEHTDR